MERTLILLKPDCVERRLMGRIIGRFEEKGLNIIAMKMLRVTPALAKQHYAEHVQKPFYPGLERFITASPIVAMVVEGLEVIRVVREMLGATSGLKATAGTIRGDYSSSRQMNLVHASDGPEAAQREIGLYFKPEEVLPYEPTLVRGFKGDEEKGGKRARIQGPSRSDGPSGASNLRGNGAANSGKDFFASKA